MKKRINLDYKDVSKKIGDIVKVKYIELISNIDKNYGIDNHNINLFNFEDVFEIVDVKISEILISYPVQIITIKSNVLNKNNITKDFLGAYFKTI